MGIEGLFFRVSVFQVFNPFRSMSEGRCPPYSQLRKIQGVKSTVDSCLACPFFLSIPGIPTFDSGCVRVGMWQPVPNVLGIDLTMRVPVYLEMLDLSSF